MPFPLGNLVDGEHFTYHSELAINDRTFRNVYSSFGDTTNTVPLNFNETSGIISFRDEDGVEWFWERSY